MYLPPAGVGEVSAQGFVSGGHVTAVVAAGVTFMEALSVEGILPGDTHVRPIVTGAPWNAYGVVLSVNCGTVWDAQRRRRRQLVEARTSTDIVYS